MANICFEEWLWKKYATEIKHFQSNNTVLNADMFRSDC